MCRPAFSADQIRQTGMKESEGIALAAIAVVVIVIIAMYGGGSSSSSAQGSTSGSAFCSGPYNLQLYDVPYRYPHYTGRAALSWDGDGRCAAYCSKGAPC